MKKFMMMVAMAFATLTASAQSEVGTLTLKPLVGITVANITDGDGDAKVGLAAGAELGYQVNETFAITAGAIYSMQGAKAEEGKLNLEYINIPILANAYLTKGLAVKVGIQPAFKVKSKIKAEGIEVDFDKVYGSDIKSFDFSIPVGLSYEISDFVIDARYNWGLTKVLDGFDSKNTVFQFTVGYKFAL
ncbi:MAG: porin family protein [Prevotella sp.]